MLAATASDTDGSVTNVEFFQGAASLGSVTISPYSVPVSNLATGSCTFSAVETGLPYLTEAEHDKAMAILKA